MKYFIALFLLLSFPVLAADEGKKDGTAPEPVASAQQEVPVPEISYMQQVDMVVTAKKDPRVLDVKITQDKKTVTVDVVVDQNQDKQETEGLAQDLIMLIKSKCLDDPPKNKKEPGKGLYDYQLNYTRPDGVGLLAAFKSAKESKLRFENPAPVLQAETPVDAIGQ